MCAANPEDLRRSSNGTSSFACTAGIGIASWGVATGGAGRGGEMNDNDTKALWEEIGSYCTDRSRPATMLRKGKKIRVAAECSGDEILSALRNAGFPVDYRGLENPRDLTFLFYLQLSPQEKADPEYTQERNG